MSVSFSTFVKTRAHDVAGHARLLLVPALISWGSLQPARAQEGAPASSMPQDRTPLFCEPFPITSHPEADIMPALSPDGKWLAYVSRQNKNYDIWVKPAGGGLALALTTNTSDDYSPSWAPNGKALVFVSRREDAEGDLYLLTLKPRADGFAPGKLQRLTANLTREAFPSFSPNGKMIAYSAGATGEEQIWLYELKSKKSYPLTTRGGTQPAWSPEGRLLAISCLTPSEGHQIFLINSDTTQADYLRRQVTFAGENFFPAFSPTGAELLVQRVDSLSHAAHLRAIALEETAVRSGRELRLTPDRKNALFPFWGKNGAIYYAADHYGNLDLWRLPAAGMVPRYPTPAEAFTQSQKIADPKIAELSYAALPFYFPDSTLWLAKAQLEIGRLHLARGDTASAAKIFAEVAEQAGGRLEAGLFAEYELAKLARSPERLQQIAARATDWPSVQAFCQLENSRMLQRAHRADAALRLAQTIPLQYPTVTPAGYEAYLLSAEILQALHQPEEAEANFVAIEKNYPGRLDWRTAASNGLLDAAVAGRAADDTLAAYQHLTQKYAALPAFAAAARFRIAEQLAREGENVLADNEYRALLALLQEHSDPFLQNLKAETVLRLMRVQITNNDFPAATQLYDKFIAPAVASAPGLAAQLAQQELTEALVRRGRLLVRAQDYDLALSLFSQARRFDPRHVEAQRGYVETMNALGRIDEAVVEYEHLSRGSPEDEILLYVLGLAYSYQGERDVKLLRRSCAAIEQALALNYRLVPAYLTLSFNYESLEQLEQKARARHKGLFEKAALALPRFLDNVRRTVTFQPPQPAERWYERAIEALTIALALNDEGSAPAREAQLALNLANNYYNLGEFGYENACRYYRLKLRYDSTFTDLKQKKVVSERFGQTSWVAGNTQEAIPLLAEAVTLARAQRDVDGELRNLLRLALVAQEAGDYENANSYYRQFINASRRENRTANVAEAWRSVAASHQKLSETEEAVTRGELSLDLLQQAGPGGFPKPQQDKFRIKFFGLPVFWWTVKPAGEESSTEGLSYAQEKELVFSIIEESWAARKDYDEALQRLAQKAESFRQRKYFTGEAVALNNLGILWYNLRDFQKAENYFLESFRLCARQQLHSGQVINLINLGNLALLQRVRGEAQVPFRVSLDSLLHVSQAALAEVAVQSPRQKLAVFNTVGNLHFYSAQQHWHTAGQNSAGHAASDGQSLEAGITRDLSALQNVVAARAAYDTALALAQQFRMPREEAMLRRNLACLLMLVGDYPAAWDHLSAARQICLASNSNDLIWRVEHLMGVLRENYRPPAGEAFAARTSGQWYQSAIAILEALPSEPEDIEQRLTEAAEQHELYTTAILQLGESSVANGAADSLARASLALAERGHANRFVNLVATRYILPKKQRQRLYWGESGGLASELRRILSALRGELRKLEAEETPRPKELARVRAALVRAANEYQQIVQEALKEDPELASFFSVQPVEVRAVQNSLRPDEAILQYYVTDELLLLWRITATEVKAYRVPCRKEELRELVGNARTAWEMRQPDNVQAAAKLSALLLGTLPDLQRYARLIIIPDDCLHYLPFSLLAYRGEVLAAQFLLTSAPSLQAWQFAGQHKNLNSASMLLVQDPTTHQDWSANLRPAGLKVSAVSGRDWRTPDSTARVQLQNAGLLHLQYAFVALPDRPLDSGFIMQLADSTGTHASGVMLPLYRLFEFELNCSVVGLENTAFPYAREQTGEEMIALQRSLIYAGAPSLIFSQWRTAPEVRAVFYRTFYSCLDKFSAVDAFQAAQLAVRARYPDPADWGAFSLRGYSGMSLEEKQEFASQYFRATVLQGNAYQDINAFQDAVHEYQRALTMAHQLGREEDVQRLYLLIKGSAVAAKDFGRAAEYEQMLLESARQAHDLRRETQSLRNLSAWRLRLHDYAGAAAAERQYLALASAANNPLAMANSYLLLAQIEHEAAAYDSAMSYAQKASDIFAAQQQALPRLQAETLLGKFALEGDHYLTALHYLEGALQSFQVRRASNEPSLQSEQRAVATATQLLGAVYGRLTAYQRALALHARALQLFEALSDTANIARAEQFMAETCWLSAEYQDALSHQQRALTLAAQLGDEMFHLRAQASLGLIELDLGEPERALEVLKQALQKSFELEEEAGTEARRLQATLQVNLSKVYLQKHSYAEALTSLQQAAQLDLQMHAPRGLLYDYLYLGQTYQQLAQPDSALQYAVRAETLAAQLYDQRAWAKALYVEGRAYLGKANRERARSAWQAALAKAEQAQLDEVQWRCLWQLGALAKKENNVTRAWDYYQRAIATLERLSAKIKVEEYRSSFIEDKTEIYEEAVLLLLEMKREAEALQMAERAKSRSFADLLANSRIDWQAGEDRALLERRDQLLESVNFVQGQITVLQAQPREQDRPLLAVLGDSLAALQRAYADLLVEIKSANPELADAVSVDPIPVSELQAMLADSVALLEYFFAKDRLLCWVVDRSHVRVSATPCERNRLSETVAQFRKAIQKRASTESFARALYDQLIKPVAPFLQASSQLIIVPHGMLHYLPFPALQRADSTYLIDTHALALAPSATVWGFCRRRSLALPSTPAPDYRVLALGNPEVGSARWDLPFAEKEIKSIEQTFESPTSYTRRQATPSALFAAVAGMNLLHFSCHGLYDANNPMFSALLLAPDSTDRTGRLEAHRIFGMKLQTTLVVLSACETGLARITGGDEVIGLARSFLFAGTPSLLASLWTVDDLATAITVKRFYRYLKAGASKAEALREAQRFVRDNHNRHPAYWASFALTGDWQ